jgi:oligopeptide transport system substrate-binding protein
LRGETACVEIAKNLFEGLVELDAELNIIPAVAQRWQIDQKGKRYKFQLRPNLTWSDDSPLTAHDFVFAWRRNLNPAIEADMAYQLYVVEGAEAFHQGHNTDPASVAVTALDDLNLEINLKVPTGYFLYLLAHPITYPQPAHIIQENPVGWSKPVDLVCNGPFKVVAWDERQEIRLGKNTFYRGFASGNLDKVNLYFIDPGLSLDYYLNHKIDWCRVDNRPDLPKHYPQESHLIQYLTTYFLSFACHCPPFNQKLVRQAFVMAIDQKELVNQVWSGVQKPALGGVIPPGMPGHSPEIGLAFDPQAAQSLLQEAGFNSGADLPPLTLVTLPGLSTTPYYLQQNWQQYLGAKVQVIENMSNDDIFTNLKQGSVHFALIGWDVDYPDPDNILRVFFHSANPYMDYLGWQNKTFDSLVEQAVSSTDHQKRLSLYHQADKILVAEDTAVGPLYYWQAHGLLRSGFKIEGAGKIIRGGIFKLKDILAG